MATSISPQSGVVSGGTAVPITGTAFTRANGVDFGMVPATAFTVNSDSQITAVAPAGPIGTVDVTVTTGGGTSPTSPADQFTYQAAGVPEIHRRQPDRVQYAGGEVVTVTGSSFTGATEVRLDRTINGKPFNLPATSFTVIDDNTIAVVTPPTQTCAVERTDFRVSLQSGLARSAQPTLASSTADNRG